MTAIINSVRKIENGFYSRAEQFMYRHPYLTFAVVLIGVPLIIAAAVSLAAAVFALPVALLYGWV